MYKETTLKGVKGTVKVSADGKEIYYQEKLVNQFLLKTRKHNHGYYCCSIGGKQFYVHHIVATAYIHNTKPLTNKMVLHVDCNSLNNHYSNLSWGNSKDLFQNRMRSNVKGAGMIGMGESYRGSSSISYTDALKIADRLDNGETARAIAKEFNVSEMSIIRIRKRYCQNKVASVRYPKEIKDTVVQLNEKHSYRHISEVTGIRYETVLKWCKERSSSN
ncbi:MAG: helix-turn-helix domain-containing protein [Bacteroidales bacterium]|nr:helix-turn-helix domain-containing protein [Bacteroidales bacterium]